MSLTATAQNTDQPGEDATIRPAGETRTHEPDGPRAAKRSAATSNASLAEMNPSLPTQVDADELRRCVATLRGERARRFRRLWAYYENPMQVDGHRFGAASTEASDRPYRQAQEWGLPPRITGFIGGDEPADPAALADHERKEVVVENDIAWRIDTSVDFLFGRSTVIDSLAPDEDRARFLSSLLRHVLAVNGGLALLQKLALVGAIYGGADLIVKLDQDAYETLLRESGSDIDGGTPDMAGATDFGSCGPDPQSTGDGDDDDPRIAAIARLIRIELVEPERAMPILHPTDSEDVLLFGQVYDAPLSQDLPSRAASPDTGPLGWVTRLWSGLSPDAGRLTVLELLGKDGWQTYHLDPATQRLSLQQRGTHPLGRLPVVHVQNIVRPFEYDGGSDVEPLVPLQDQLNTRLSDRAQRLTMQSAKIYLGVGIADFAEQPVAPGRMWSTDNPDARIDEFGGDTHSPAEDAAVREIREALDKQSGVSPVAAGAIRGRVGNLTSAAALRLTFQALLSRTQRKRINYGTAIEQVCDLALAWLDAVGVVKTTPQDRRVRLTWPDPIPADSAAELAQAKQKLDLGIDRALVLRELGYPEQIEPESPSATDKSANTTSGSDEPGDDASTGDDLDSSTSQP